MRLKNRKKALENATRKSVKKEMAKPRICKSARITELNLDTTRIAESPSTTIPGTINKIIQPRIRTNPEMAQIVLEGPENQYRSLRIDNTLTDEHGDDVSLKKGAHVEVTITIKDANWRR
jgi:hypothetical protein